VKKLEGGVGIFRLWGGNQFLKHRGSGLGSEDARGALKPSSQKELAKNTIGREGSGKTLLRSSGKEEGRAVKKGAERSGENKRERPGGGGGGAEVCLQM